MRVRACADGSASGNKFLIPSKKMALNHRYLIFYLPLSSQGKDSTHAASGMYAVRGAMRSMGVWEDGGMGEEGEEARWPVLLGSASARIVNDSLMRVVHDPLEPLNAFEDVQQTQGDGSH